MIDADFRREIEIGAIELELRTLEAGGIPSRVRSPDLPEREIARRVAFLAEIGRRVLSTSGRD